MITNPENANPGAPPGVSPDITLSGARHLFHPSADKTEPQFTPRKQSQQRIGPEIPLVIMLCDLCVLGVEKSDFGQFAEEIQVRLHLVFGRKVSEGVPPGVVGEALALGRLADEPIEGGDEA